MERIINYILIGTQVAIFLYAFIVSLVNLYKGKNYKENDKQLQRLFEIVTKVAPDIVKSVETMYKGSSSEVKKSAAMDKLTLYCLQNGLTLENDYLSAIIEDIINVSKNVNYNTNAISAYKE